MMKKKNVYKLKVAPEALSFTIIGISSHENDYRLAWNLNESLGLKLAQTDHFIPKIGGAFACFVHRDAEQTFRLISNRRNNGYLLNTYKNFDFILKFEKNLDENDITLWLQELKKVALVSAVMQIPLNKEIASLLVTEN
jgi:hypothetical protein